MNLHAWYPAEQYTDVDIELLQELEEQALTQIRKLRRFERVEVRVPVRLDAANHGDVAPTVKGVTQDLSRGGCRAIMRAAPHVGDVYRLEIEMDRDLVKTTYARCLRCALLRDDAYDVAFHFLGELEIPGGDDENDAA